ncbi:MAG: hypothetical protein JWO71_1148 [Candidatus Acidoferrum typicum]|nr:hypothetical protein [Candidatus Acidoferrum typicum]
MIAAMLMSLPDALNLLILGSVLILFGELSRRVFVSLEKGSELNPDENLVSKVASHNEDAFVRSHLAAASHEASVLSVTPKQLSLARPN